MKDNNRSIRENTNSRNRRLKRHCKKWGGIKNVISKN